MPTACRGSGNTRSTNDAAGIFTMTGGSSPTYMKKERGNRVNEGRLSKPTDHEAGLRELMRILVEQLVDDWLAEQAAAPRQEGVTVATAPEQVQNSTA